MRKNITKFLLLVIAFTFALSINYIFAAWTGPIQATPGGNTPTPVHIGTTNQVNDGSVWKSLTSGDTTIITSDVTDCNNFGGNWVDSQGVCYFPAAGECPSGWTQKESYSSTQGNTCAGKSCLGTYGNDIYGTSCSTGSHFRTNKDKEDCVYMSINEFELKYGNCFPNNIECLATQTEVGCVKTE